MTTDRFRSVAHALRPFISDTYALLKATDAVVALDSEISAPVVSERVIKSPDGYATYNRVTGMWDYDPGYLVARCLNDEAILLFVADKKRISAIKELRRFVPGAGLKACKDAIESEAVEMASRLRFPATWESNH